MVHCSLQISESIKSTIDDRSHHPPPFIPPPNSLFIFTAWSNWWKSLSFSHSRCLAETEDMESSGLKWGSLVIFKILTDCFITLHTVQHCLLTLVVLHHCPSLLSLPPLPPSTAYWLPGFRMTKPGLHFLSSDFLCAARPDQLTVIQTSIFPCESQSVKPRKIATVFTWSSSCPELLVVGRQVLTWDLGWTDIAPLLSNS